MYIHGYTKEYASLILVAYFKLAQFGDVVNSMVSDSWELNFNSLRATLLGRSTKDFVSRPRLEWTCSSPLSIEVEQY